MIKFVLYIILDKKISYQKNGKKISVKHESKTFKIINSNNLTCHWFGFAESKERRDLDEKIDFELFLENTPQISIDLYIGSKFYQALWYLFNEDFRTIDDEMVEVGAKIFEDLKEDYTKVKEFLCKYKGNKIFSCLEP